MHCYILYGLFMVLRHICLVHYSFGTVSTWFCVVDYSIIVCHFSLVYSKTFSWNHCTLHWHGLDIWRSCFIGYTERILYKICRPMYEVTLLIGDYILRRYGKTLSMEGWHSCIGIKDKKFNQSVGLRVLLFLFGKSQLQVACMIFYNKSLFNSHKVNASVH